MGKADRISGTFWFLFSLFISYESYKLSLGTVRQPGPGFLFFWTGIVIAILSLIVIFASFKKEPGMESRESMLVRSNITKLLLVVGSLILYALLMEWLGFLIVTLLLFVFLLRVVEKKKTWFALFVSLIVTGLSYLLFELGLQSQLPKGLLEVLRL
jgi:putative tricarboxylic transport membrane protein